ncbi:hypothetical protein JX265_013603 [Neoarthrinium moseri]|uniref:Uncharacterized protein n=1 Tax=Neoarthrinium moseri TaxID=1658444 RepID=A0A9P9W8B2_9PEZI|nr:hypothetical protein JX266_013532 [Neoarthrinium moseri]KAI1849538.1 hypothetical protein JX265_013603 [Neoarthrinium moseri]
MGARVVVGGGGSLRLGLRQGFIQWPLGIASCGLQKRGERRKPVATIDAGHAPVEHTTQQVTSVSFPPIESDDMRFENQ